MNGKTKPAGDDKKRRAAKSKNTFVTKNGTAIKLNRSLGERLKAGREARARRKAAYLATLPKNPFKRFLFRLHPRQLARYWFSRDGGIMALKIIGIGIVVGFVLIVGIFAYFRKDLPNIKDLTAQSLGGSVNYYDRTGQTLLFQDYVDVKRVPVATGNMSKYIRMSTVATEDKDFYKHGAFDLRGIFRAAVNNVIGGGTTQGGSTISMQFAKIDQGNTANRTVGNKAKELILAVEMEREFSKEDILTGYLNAIPYSPLSYGVQAASQEYFGVDAKNLTIEQAAFLTAIPQSPSVYSPYGPRYDPARLIGRMQYIIGLMVEQGMITKQEAETAKSVDILAQVKPQQPSHWTGIKAPGFVQAAKAELITERLGEAAVKLGGWKVITTVDMKLQELAEKSVDDGMAQIRRQGGDTAAFVAMDNATGQIVALVGNGDNDIIANKEFGENNYVHGLRVSPGSTFKPYDYATFIENNNAGAGSVFYDARGKLTNANYPCTNDSNCLRDYDRNYPGPVTIRYALGGSRNVPAVKAMLSAVPNDGSPDRVASINKTISTAEAMMGNKYGYSCFDLGTNVAAVPRDTQGSQCYGSSAIGDGAYLFLDDHVTGLSTLARMGQQLPHTYILKITDSANKTVYEFKQPTPKQVLRPDTAYILNDMASDPNASYMGGKFHRSVNGWHFAIKTGTTNDSFDGLMASWSTKYTAVTWAGYHTRNKAMSGFMETMTRPIMGAWMKGAHTGLPAVNWEKPSGVKTLPAYVITKKISSNGEVVPSTSTDLFPSWYKQPEGDTAQVMDLVSNKTATECTPELARSSSSQQGGNHNLFSIDVFVGVPGGNNQPSSDSIDDVHNCNDEKPSILLTKQGSGINCNTGNGDGCEFNVFVSKGTHALSGGTYTTSPAGTLIVTVNGQDLAPKPISSISGCNDSNCNYVFRYDTSTAGSYVIQARVVDSVLYSTTSESKTVNYSD